MCTLMITFRTMFITIDWTIFYGACVCAGIFHLPTRGTVIASLNAFMSTFSLHGSIRFYPITAALAIIITPIIITFGLAFSCEVTGLRITSTPAVMTRKAFINAPLHVAVFNVISKGFLIF